MYRAAIVDMQQPSIAQIIMCNSDDCNDDCQCTPLFAGYDPTNSTLKSQNNVCCWTVFIHRITQSPSRQ